MNVMTFRPALAALLVLTSLAASAAEVTPAATGQNVQASTGKMAEDYLVAHPGKLGEAISAYLVEHPEFLVAASENLHQRQQAAQMQAMVKLALEHQDALLNADSPSVGPKSARAAVVMFFDYQCVYCSKVAPVVSSLMKANPDVRFVFKEFPIFAQRWPVSGQAARTGLKVWEEKGAEAYITYHNALYATGHMEGQLTAEDVHKAAAPYLSAATLKALDTRVDNSPEETVLADVRHLAGQMHFTGTPAFVIMPQADSPAAAKVTVLPGATTQETLQGAITKAKGQ
ncbi:DsbA family protein [Klebsiella aerogenes]|uniref:DsbA family protein n=1 Tax=Klebsiella aerogenes TaxID=548 RepID=UPI001F302AF2|nr:DsbA family protein [Klebsiella aerogenes]